MRILGAIIAGGKSSRMGGQEKAFLELGGQTLISHIVQRLAPQVDEIIINANGEAARFQLTGLAVVADQIASGGTPLAGLEAVLSHATEYGFDAVISVPSDTPFLPHDFVARLSGPNAAIAVSAGQEHYLTGFWPSSLAADLRDEITQKGLRRMQDWVRICGARKVEWDAAPFDPFFNINTREDLALAKHWLERQS
jgi:molybdenum cofactor guanylyltransferase